MVSPSLSEADCGVLFFHNEGYSTMCGHGIIGLVTVLLENAMIPCTEPETTVRLETPSGLVTAKASIQKGRVSWVAFRNVPSFVVDLDQRVEVPGVGVVPYDLAFGGDLLCLLPG
jgi:proline racemase